MPQTAVRQLSPPRWFAPNAASFVFALNRNQWLGAMVRTQDIGNRLLSGHR
jgi:hypothetical protein